MAIKILKLFVSIPLSLILFSCSIKVPVITSIDPKIGIMGEVITLKGYNFGAEREESYVTIAGVSPTHSAYFAWEDDMIMVRVPESGESGLVYVHVRGRKSNGVLFSNSAAVPRPIEGEEFGMEPRISAVRPQTGVPGTAVIITGSNFGTARESSNSNYGVFFSWDFEQPENLLTARESEFIEVTETELGYESWGAREIRVRVPDGAVSGNLEIRTAHGKSKPVFFDVSGKPGYKTFKEKRGYTISYSVDAKILEATRPNTLYLWIPLPVTSPSQRNVSLISRNTAPFVENHRGVSLFKLDNITQGSSHTITLSFNVEVYTMETGIRPVYIRQEDNPLHALYTHNTSLTPGDNPQIKTMAALVTGREQNPYIKARLIYDWILNNIEITEISNTVPVNNAVEAMEKKQANSYYAALLYTSMARAAGLPCITVAGVLVNRTGQTIRHYWNELWIDSFGWLPVDPAMGAGAAPESFITKQDTVNYYFGNLDNMRIAFSRGELILSQIDSKGRLVSHTESYSLQNIWEEAAGGLTSYSSLWGEIIISGIYAQ
jgi:hypothetical protein